MPRTQIQLISQLCPLLVIVKAKNTPYRPQSNDMIERFYGTLQQMLPMFVNENHNDYIKKFQNVLLFAKLLKRNIVIN